MRRTAHRPGRARPLHGVDDRRGRARARPVAVDPASPAARRPAAAETAHTYDDGGMIGFGSVGLTDPPMPQPLNSPVFSGVATDDGNGYLLANADGASPVR